MKLTNAHKFQIENDIIADVKTVDYVSKVNDLVQKAAIARIPGLVKDAYMHYPDLIIKTHMYVYLEGDSSYGSTDISVMVPGIGGHNMSHFLAELRAHPGFVELMKAKKIQDLSLADLRKEIKAILSGCTTDTAVLQIMPEFEKYLPEQMAKKKGLPATTNLANKLKGMGWPKTDSVGPQ